MTNNIGLSYIDYYLPDKVQSVEDFVKNFNSEFLPTAFDDLDEYQYFLKYVLKLKEFRIEDLKTEMEIIDSLIEKMFSRINLSPGDIDMIIIASEPIKNELLDGKILVKKHRLTNCCIKNISSHHCSNLEVAVNVAREEIINNNSINNVLVVNCSIFYTDKDRVMGNYAVLGDAGGLVLISKNSKIELVDSYILSIGKEIDNSIYHSKYYMECLSNIMQKNKLVNNNIDHVIIQSANPLLVSQCVAAAGLDTNKIYLSNMGKYGHLGCVDFLINLTDIHQEGEGKLILALGMGLGGTYTASLLKF